jgi:Putative regulator of cell autolysis
MKKILVHSVVWIILTYFLFFSLSLFLPGSQALVRSTLAIGLMALTFYSSAYLLTNWLLIDRWKPVYFLIAAFVLAVVLSVFRVKLLGLLPGDAVLSGRISPDFFSPDNNLYFGKRLWLLNRLETERVPFFPGFLMNVVVITIATLFRLYENKTRKEQESREELQRSQEAQIIYLKSQVNPHFLFNTLNNLYGLSYSKSDLAPQMVLGLSETMRYLIYETEQKLVPLEKELHFIRNYLDLEKMRLSFPENIRDNIRVSNSSVFVPPLLLLPFIENCFKHGNIGKEEDGWMELDINDGNGDLYFTCKNSYSQLVQSPSAKPGIGLTNVQKRLELIFRGKFELETRNQDGEYMVSLQFPVFLKKDDL